MNKIMAFLRFTFIFFTAKENCSSLRVSNLSGNHFWLLVLLFSHIHRCWSRFCGFCQSRVFSKFIWKSFVSFSILLLSLYVWKVLSFSFDACKRIPGSSWILQSGRHKMHSQSGSLLLSAVHYIGFPVFIKWLTGVSQLGSFYCRVAHIFVPNLHCALLSCAALGIRILMKSTASSPDSFLIRIFLGLNTYS